jgi:SAM-dependent methyltransferase
MTVDGPGRGFGAVAEEYDRARPTYPPVLVAELLQGSPADVLDVGCGTGKAARLFQGGARRVLGVEPDARMAVVARGHGIEVEVAPFETWDDAGRRFDLLISPRPGTASTQCSGLRRPRRYCDRMRGSLPSGAPEEHTPEMQAVWEEVYRTHAPDLLATSFALGVRHAIDAGNDLDAAALAAGPFADVVPGERRKYHWAVEYAPRQWVEHVATASDHLALGPETRAWLLAAVELALRSLGPSFTVPTRPTC